MINFLTSRKHIFLIRIFYSLNLFLLILFAVNFSYASEQNFSNSHINVIYNNEVLNARPKFLKESGRPKASVGTILYICNSKLDPFLLIGQENSDKVDAGTYCELGGNAELEAPGKAETFLNGCIRECSEESAKIYTLDPEYVLLNSYTYYNVTPTKREEVYIFLKAPYYFSASDLLIATEKQLEAKYKEKKKFKWVKLSDLHLCTKDKCNVHDIDGEEETIYLREYFYKTLHNPKVQNILGKLCSK